jgi:hypothetical protein
MVTQVMETVALDLKNSACHSALNFSCNSETQSR